MRTITKRQLDNLKLGRVKGIKRPGLRGVPKSEEVKRKISETSKGRHYSLGTEWKKGHTPEGSVLFKKGQAPWNKGKKFPKRSGANSKSWKGGRTLHQHKYWLVSKPDHPKADNKGYVREHRLVIENYLGRYLKEDELVHHKDGDTMNNDINNLEIVSRSAHIEFHREELYKARWKN